MLAGIVLLSTAVGIIAMGATFALALPTWIALLCYPVIGSLALLLCAAVRSGRTDFADRPDGLQGRATQG